MCRPFVCPMFKNGVSSLLVCVRLLKYRKEHSYGWENARVAKSY